ncbi:hypothetical protein [Bacillus cereus group sp. MYBK215-1]|uniref:hypothetical protein n=1 Tax=unclassified Bacillus cereus group TaxID=2750818 RepID=UPI003F794058
MYTEIEKMFQAEVRDKKRTASGVHHKTGKRGYTGVLRFPHETLKGKAKKEYKGTGKVVKYNMFDTIMKYTDFRNLPIDKQKHLLTGYRIKHTNKKIMEAWSLNNVQYYDKLLPELGVKKAEGRGRRQGTTNKKDDNSAIVTALPEVKPAYVSEENVSTPTIEHTSKPTEAIVTAAIAEKQPENNFVTKESLFKEDGLHLNLNGTYTPQQLVRKLEKLAILLDGEESDFKISLSINELESTKE